MDKVYIGVAGWNVPKPYAHFFPMEGSHLSRYAQTFNAVEINTSFYRVHKPATYKRWAESVPEDFKFSVKLFQQFTHKKKFEIDLSELSENISGIKELGKKLGAILVQTPGRFQFEEDLASDFFSCLRDHYDGVLVFEPRHISFSSEESLRILEKNQITFVKADPPRVEHFSIRSSKALYYRLHGFPKVYESSYELDFLLNVKREIESSSFSTAWVIFDNTKYFAATENAKTFQNLFLKKDTQIQANV